MVAVYDNNTPGDKSDDRAGMSNVTCSHSITHHVTHVTTEPAGRTLPVVAVYDNNTPGDKSDNRAGMSNVTCSHSITHQVTHVTTELAGRTLPVVVGSGWESPDCDDLPSLASLSPTATQSTVRP